MQTSRAPISVPTVPGAAGWAASFAAGPGYLAACTAGLPSDATVDAMHAFVARWAGGGLDALAIGAKFEECRALFARIAAVSPSEVAIGSQVSQFASIVATAVPDGGEVLSLRATSPRSRTRSSSSRIAGCACATSRSPTLRTRSPPTPHSSRSRSCSLRAERVADHAAIVTAAERAGARTFVDLTQSLGWLPIGGDTFDYTVCHAYKWLCAPRGTAFLTVRSGLEDTLRPLAAGWCSAEDVWSSCYAGHTPLAVGAGRFDLSPVWPAIGGTLAALRECAERDPAAVHAHALGLANAARAVLGLPAGDSAIVTWADPDGADLAALTAGGITASGRAGNARVAFHLWNTAEDVAQLAAALGR